MVVSALGLPILLQATNTQLDGLFAGLGAGDQVRGRVVELLPQDKAVMNLRGQNVVAQLPAGSLVQKGDALLLKVTQSQAGVAGKGGSLTLRLLTDPAAVLAAAAAVPSSAATHALPAQGLLEQALGNARLPVSNLTLTVAQTLARLGAPLDAVGLQRAVQSTEALLANENPAGTGAGAAPNPQVQRGLQAALEQLRLAAQFSPSGQDRLLLQQAMRDLGQALTLEPLAALSVPAVPSDSGSANVPSSFVEPGGPAALPVTVPTAPSVLALATVDPMLPPNVPAAAPALSQRPMALAAVDQAVSQLLLQPSAAGVETLALALGQLQAGSSNATPTAVLLPNTSPVASPLGPIPGPAAPQNASWVDSLPSLPARREAMVQLLAVTASPSEAGPLVTTTILAQAQALAQAYASPDTAASRALVAAVQAQQPQAAPAQILADARLALGRAMEVLQGPGTPTQLLVPTALRGLLQDAGLATPKVNLSQLPPEHVAEAVAWLQARDLPAQRPLVEAVASWINQDQTALPATQKAIVQTQSLPTPLMDAHPTLGQALQQVQRALQQSSLSPAAQGLDQQLGQWSRTQGVDFESRLGSATASAEAPAPADPAAPLLKAALEAVDALKPALLRLEVELKAAIKDPQAQAAPVARHLESALQQTQAAVQALNAVPLQAQPAPAYDSVHLPLPVLLNGPLGDGKLSVTWRHGRERRLDDTEPVNVAVALNTDSLGPVKVLLQVWKGSANVRVIGADPSAAQYLAGGADELRSGFSQRTPFQLRTLEFAAAEGGPQGSAPNLDTPGPAAGGGLNLSA